MPNHYTNVITVFPGHRNDDEEDDGIHDRLVARKWLDKPLARVMPMPAGLEGTQSPAPPGAETNRLVREYGASDWYEWQKLNRGCKWDAYDCDGPNAIISLPGDCGCVQITFCTAWGPPNAEVRRRLAQELLGEYGAGRVVWSGLQPRDDSFQAVGEWEWTPGPRLVADLA